MNLEIKMKDCQCNSIDSNVNLGLSFYKNKNEMRWLEMSDVCIALSNQSFSPQSKIEREFCTHNQIAIKHEVSSVMLLKSTTQNT